MLYILLIVCLVFILCCFLMKKSLFLALAVSILWAVSYTYAAIPVDTYPICEKNASGGVVCPSLSGQMVPENTLIMLKDFCPQWDTSLIKFDKTCQFSTGSDFKVNESGMVLVPFGKIAKYLKIGNSLEDASFYPKAPALTWATVQQQFLKTGAGDDSSLVLVICAFLWLVAYFGFGFVAFKK